MAFSAPNSESGTDVLSDGSWSDLLQHIPIVNRLCAPKAHAQVLGVEVTTLQVLSVLARSGSRYCGG